MTSPLDERVVERVNELGSTAWSGRAYRYSKRQRDPLSGEGARRFGGRWNPRDVFPAVYLGQPVEVASRELDRAAEAAAIEPLVMLDAGFDLHTIDVEALQVLDLREEAALRHVGLAPEDVVDEDRTACQAVGHAAWFLEMQGVVAPSASGVGLVITAFETRVPVGALSLISSVPFTRGNYVPANA